MTTGIVIEDEIETVYKKIILKRDIQQVPFFNTAGDTTLIFLCVSSSFLYVVSTPQSIFIHLLLSFNLKSFIYTDQIISCVYNTVISNVQ